MLQNKIFQNYILEIFKIFLTILFGLTIIAWTVRAVNFLDLIVESGYPIITYFQYSFLNFIGIFTKFIPLSFLIALTIFIIRQINENELVILWTSGVKKIKIVNLFILSSLIVSIFYLIFSVFVTPAALNKSRQLLGNENLSSFLPTVRVQQFSDSFKGLTFIVDQKLNNQIKNIFLHDSSNTLKNISSNNTKRKSNTIIANNGIIDEKRMILFSGQIISTDKENNESDVIKFEQLNIDLTNIQSNTIKQPKIQETSTLKLIGCLNKNYFNDKNCRGNIEKEILPTLNRRIVLPFFIPVLALVVSFMLVKHNRSIFFNKISIFGYSFIILIYAELVIRYTGISKTMGNLFLLSPIILYLLTYFILRLKLSKE